MALLNGPFVYTPEPTLTGYTPKLAATRLALVNTWATLTGATDDVASKVDDFVRYLQNNANGYNGFNNAWDEYSNVWVFTGAGGLGQIGTPLKGTITLGTEGGVSAADVSLAMGVGDGIGASPKNLLLPITANTAWDMGIFLTEMSHTNANYMQYTGTIGAAAARYFSMGGGIQTRDNTAGDQAVSGELSTGSGWRRFQATPGYYRAYIENSPRYVFGPYDGGANQDATLNPPVNSPSSNVRILNGSGARIRVIAWKQSTIYYPYLPDGLPTNGPWTIACRQLDAALRNKIPRHVIVLGDSISAGSNQKTRQSWVPWAETILGNTRFINVSRSGNGVLPRAASAQPGMYQDYLDNVLPFINAGMCEHIVWASGVNDVNFRGTLAANGYPGVDVSDAALILAIKTELLKTIDKAIADGIPASRQTLVGKMYGPVPWNNRAVSDQALIQAGDERNIRFVDVFGLSQLSNPALRDTWYSNNINTFGAPFDNIHPNNAGQSLYADFFLRGNTVERALSLYSAAPTFPTVNNGTYEVGERFRVNRNGWITKLRNYRFATSPQTARAMKLWQVGGTQILAVVTESESGTGWWEAALPFPVQVTAGQEFIVSTAVTGDRASLTRGDLAIDFNSVEMTRLEGRSSATADTFPADVGPPTNSNGIDVVLVVAAPVFIAGAIGSTEVTDRSNLYSPFLAGNLAARELIDRSNIAASLTAPQPPPNITAVNRTIAETGSPVILTVTSTQYVTGVFFGGVPAVSYTIINATTIQATLPYSLVGAFSFQVRGTNGALSGPSAVITVRAGQQDGRSASKKRGRRLF